MPEPSFVLLYVQDPTASSAFYADLLGQPPLEAAPNFALFALPGGMRLGLWARHDVQPPATTPAGAVELAFTVADVDACHADWRRRGLEIIQPPTRMDFGTTFLARDPDGHRLRVFRPAAPPAA